MSLNFSHFHLLQNHWANFNKTWHKVFLSEGIQVRSNEEPRPFPRSDDYEIAKVHWWVWKIFFSRTTGPISSKLGTNHFWVKGIQVFTNEGPRCFSRGDNYEIVKIHWHLLQKHLANFQSKLAEIILLFKLKSHAFFAREKNCEIVKIHWWILKIFSRTIGPISTKLSTSF